MRQAYSGSDQLRTITMPGMNYESIFQLVPRNDAELIDAAMIKAATTTRRRQSALQLHFMSASLFNNTAN